MRGLSALLTVVLSAPGALAQGQPATRTAAPHTPAAAPAPARPAPAYAVVQGQHTEGAGPFQQLTVFCPAGHRAFGAGFSALVRLPPKTPTSPPSFAEGGLDQVRSVPDIDGSGWQVQGVSPDAARLKQPWRLVVRVVCVATAD